MSTTAIRPSRDEDVPAVQAIYAHAVIHGLATFEYDPPDAAEVARRRASVVALGLPYLVSEMDGRVVAYAYAGPYRPRIGYRYSLENSIYVAPDMAGRGIGRPLLRALIDGCEPLGYRQMVAVIGDSANHASIGLHVACGFAKVGLLRSVGFKHGRWVDSVLMQRPLGPGDATLPA
jgi:L-amino acid N-acyltransferase YncA